MNIPSKKKVLLTVNNSLLSGIEKFCLLLAEHINKEKFDITIALPEYGPFVELLKEKRIRYIIFNNGKSSKHSLKGIRNLYKIIKKNKYDIIHAQAGIPPCIIGKILRIQKNIEHKHGLDFTIEEIENMNRIKILYESFKKHFVNKTITGCENDKNNLIKYFKYKSRDVQVVYNGIEKNIPQIKKTKINSSQFIVGNIGRLTYQKGQEYLIEAARILYNKGYNDLIFNIYGSGKNYSLLSNLITKYDLEKKIFLKGYINNVSAVLSEIDLFVMPSRYEGIPYMILEAMKSKIPIVCTDVGGLREVIKNNWNGLLVEKEKPELLAEKILELYKDDFFRKNLSYNAYNDFLDNFTIEKTIAQIEEIYNI